MRRRRLYPYLDRDITTGTDNAVDPRGELCDAGIVHAEGERRDQRLARRIRDQGHRLVLAEIHRDEQTPIRKDLTDSGRSRRDITTMSMHHDKT